MNWTCPCVFPGLEKKSCGSCCCEARRDWGLPGYCTRHFWGQGGTVWRFRLAGITEAFLFPSFLLLWMSCIRFVRKSLEGMHLRKCLGLVSHATPTGDKRNEEPWCGLWRNEPRPGPACSHSHTQQAREVLGWTGKFCLSLCRDNFLTDTTNCFMGFPYFGLLVFQVPCGLRQQVNALIQTPFKNFVIPNIKPCAFTILYQLGARLVFYAEFVFVLNMLSSAAFGFRGFITCFSARFVSSALPAAFVTRYDSSDLIPFVRMPCDVWRSSNCLPVCQVSSPVKIPGVTVCSIKQQCLHFLKLIVSEKRQWKWFIASITIKFPFVGTRNSILKWMQSSHVN